MANLGDITVRLLLEIVEADKNAKKYSASLKSVEASSKSAEVATDQLTRSSVRFQDNMANAHQRVEGFRSVLSLLSNTFGQLVTAYQEQEIATAKLANGLKNVGEGQTALNRLSEQASELQKNTTFGDEQIQNAQSMLTTFKKSSAEIEILTPRILDLAAAYQTNGEATMDLQQVAVMLGKINEDTIGSLNRVGVAFTKEQEAKLKSTKGTEQALILAEILDNNFKGMAVTIGQTTGGQMEIFRKQTGELQESLGELISKSVKPFLELLIPVIQYLANGSEATKRMTLSVIALGTAFVAIGTSLGGLPFIIGAIIAAFYTLDAAGSTTVKRMREVSDATLKTAQVQGEMKKVLEDLGLSANNMAEAYDNIGIAIANMTATQIANTRDFILAEKAKVMAFIETNKALGTANIPDFNLPDGGKSLENTAKFVFSADLSKFDEILAQIETRSKSLKTSDGTTKSGTTGTGPSTAKEELTYLAQLKEDLLKLEERIAKQTTQESEAEGLFVKKKDLETLIEYVGNLDKYKKVIGEIAVLNSQGSEIKEIEVKDDFYTQLERMKANEYREKLRLDHMASIYDKIVSDLQSASSIASAITSKLSQGGKDFLYWINAALRVAIQIARLVQKKDSEGGISFGDILGVVGTVVPFFLASGGTVPGSGSGDTVPAMLTPGEFVLNKRSVSRLGTGFLNMLNGGGSVISQTPAAAMAGVQNIVNINLNGELTDQLMHKIVSKGNTIVNVRNKNSNF